MSKDSPALRQRKDRGRHERNQGTRQDARDRQAFLPGHSHGRLAHRCPTLFFCSTSAHRDWPSKLRISLTTYRSNRRYA